MGTKPRVGSISGFYHVFQRGVNQFDIFEDNADRRFYLDHLVKYTAELGVELHAWCLMSNHTHLLLRCDLSALSDAMRTLGSVYARYFNQRHNRSGPLFEGRFGSVAIETEAQLLTVIRYIHRNPIYHERAALAGNYRWSSYREYCSTLSETCNTAFSLALFGGIEGFIKFHGNWEDPTRHLDIGTSGPMSDDEARYRANRALKNAGFLVRVSRIGNLSQKMRDSAIACVKRAVGCSLRQLQRLTALPYSIIRMALGLSSRRPNAHTENGNTTNPEPSAITAALCAIGRAASFVLPRYTHIERKEGVQSSFGNTNESIRLLPFPALST